MSNQKRGPVLIDLDDQTAAAPAAAPVVLDMPHQNAAMVQGPQPPRANLRDWRGGSGLSCWR